MTLEELSESQIHLADLLASVGAGNSKYVTRWQSRCLILPTLKCRLWYCLLVCWRWNVISRLQWREKCSNQMNRLTYIHSTVLYD